MDEREKRNKVVTNIMGWTEGGAGMDGTGEGKRNGGREGGPGR